MTMTSSTTPTTNPSTSAESARAWRAPCGRAGRDRRDGLAAREGDLPEHRLAVRPMAGRDWPADPGEGRGWQVGGGPVDPVDPRQVGKSYLLGCIIFALCLLNPKLRVIWTSHHTATTEEMYEAMKDLAAHKRVAPHVTKCIALQGSRWRIQFRTARGSTSVPARRASVEARPRSASWCWTSSSTSPAGRWRTWRRRRTPATTRSSCAPAHRPARGQRRGVPAATQGRARGAVGRHALRGVLRRPGRRPRRPQAVGEGEPVVPEAHQGAGVPAAEEDPRASTTSAARRWASGTTRDNALVMPNWPLCATPTNGPEAAASVSRGPDRVWVSLGAASGG
jgi:hypothetical protein